MSEKIWKKFERSLIKEVSTVDVTVLKKLKSNFMEAPEHYLLSKDFEIVTNDTIEKISYDKLKVYIHLLEFKKTLKAATKLKRKLPLESENISKRRKLAEAEDNLVVVIKEEEDFLDYYNGCPTTTNRVEIPPQPTESQTKIDKYIAKLEDVLQSTKIQIEKLEEEELSLDDLDHENNSFMMLDKLKAHSVKVWRKICKLRNTTSKLHRRILKTFTFKGTIYPNLNIKIEEFVKEKKFPDYHDIKGVVLSFINDNQIKMSGQKMSQLAVDIFTQIGNQLKKKRINDFVSYFGNHLTDQVKLNENPIIKDDNLRRILLRNHAAGEIKMDEVLDKFCKIEQGLPNKTDENASDISTEHSDLSENEEIDENLDNINVEELRQQAVPPSSEPEIDAEVENEEEPEISQSVTLTNDVDVITDYCANQMQPQSPLVTVDIQPERNPEADIKEIEGHTFRFNVEQLRGGEDSARFPSTITIIDSSDESEAPSLKDDCHDDGDYVYSSKLDDFFVASRPIAIVDTGICIDIEDSDDDCQ